MLTRAEKRLSEKAFRKGFQVRRASEEAQRRAAAAEERQLALAEQKEALEAALREAQEQRDVEAQQRETAETRCGAGEISKEKKKKAKSNAKRDSEEASLAGSKNSSIACKSEWLSVKAGSSASRHDAL